MKLSIEAKVGLIGIVTLVVLIWGINYLKGQNILKSSYTLYAFYEDSGGLENSAPVLMNGFKIGYVEAIELQPQAPIPVTVTLHIEKAYLLGKKSQAILFSADLLGGKAIRIDAFKEEALLQNGDTIQALTESDFLSSLGEQAGPVLERIGQLSTSLDSLAANLNILLSSDASRLTLENLEDISAAIKSSLEPGGSLYNSFSHLESFTAMLEEQEEELASMSSSLNSVSQDLDSARIDLLSQELRSTTKEFKMLLEKINSGEGSIGRLIYSDSMHNHLENLVTDLDSLIVDLNENPKKYVQFSLFGKSQK
jgi:phospholipid/cholesterol/gamma-HCH transport system substrate-binding protein